MQQMTHSSGSSDSHERLAVLIVGAGPTGLTLALDLARRGVACRIIEKAPTFFTGSRGKGIQPRSQEVFDDLGVIEQLIASGGDYPRMRIHLGGFAFPLNMFKRSAVTSDVPYPNILMVPQARTETVLRERLGSYGVSVELGADLTGFEQDDEGVTATVVREGASERIRARYLVGADGGHSFVRKELGVGFQGESLSDDEMLVGDVRVDGLSRDFWHVWPRTKTGAVSLCPLPNTDAFQLVMQLPAGGAVPELTERAVQEFFRANVKQRGIWLHDPSWLSIYRPNVRMVDRYRVGRVFLAGDAAHVHPPTGGQGLNTGVQDAYNLGWKLAQVVRGASEALLDTYEEERLPIAASVLGLSTKLFRQAAEKRLQKQQRGAETKQLGLHYRGSTLACDEGHASSSLRAGDRAPDAPCQGADGHDIKLFDVFRGPQFTLLVFSKRPQTALTAEITRAFGDDVRAYSVVRSGAATDDRTLVDSHGDVRRSYGVKGDALVLIRPDGYIGLVSGTLSADVVSRYLSQCVARERSVATS